MIVTRSVWPNGKALGWYVDVIGSIPRFGSPFSSELAVYGQSLALNLTINEL